MELKEQNLGEELYNLLAELLNSKMKPGRLWTVFVENTGFCCYLCYIEDHVHAGKLTEHLRVVPGRMTDHFKQSGSKGIDHADPRGRGQTSCKCSITEEGKKQAVQMRQKISREYEGVFRILGQKDTEELIRLLKIVLSYPDAKGDKTRVIRENDKRQLVRQGELLLYIEKNEEGVTLLRCYGDSRLSHCRIWWMVLR